MSFEPGNTLGNYLNEQIDLPQDAEERFLVLKKTLEDHAKIINRKDTGQYDEIEVPIGQQFLSSDIQVKRSVLRKVINFGALPNAAVKTVAHGLTSYSAITFTRIYGVANNPGIGAIPLPFATPLALSSNISLVVDVTNVLVTTAADYSPFTRAFIVLEYVRD